MKDKFNEKIYMSELAKKQTMENVKYFSILGLCTHTYAATQTMLQIWDNVRKYSLSNEMSEKTFKMWNIQQIFSFMSANNERVLKPRR